MKRLKGKILNNNGESLAETLISLTIAGVAMIILAGALVSAAKTNIKAKTMNTFMYSTEGATTVGSAVVSIGYSGGMPVRLDSLEGTNIEVCSDKYTVGEEERDYYYWTTTIEESAKEASSVASTGE